MRWIALIIVLGALVGCASGSSKVTGKTRAEIPVETVTLYRQPPPSYETVGLVVATAPPFRSSRYKMVQEVLVAEWKRQAAKMGANGVLSHSACVSMQCDNRQELGYMFWLMLKTVMGMEVRVEAWAIYVPQYGYY